MNEAANYSYLSFLRNMRFFETLINASHNVSAHKEKSNVVAVIKAHAIECKIAMAQKFIKNHKRIHSSMVSYKKRNNKIPYV